MKLAMSIGRKRHHHLDEVLHAHFWKRQPASASWSNTTRGRRAEGRPDRTGHARPDTARLRSRVPFLKIVPAVHIRADLTLRLGKVVHDYPQQPVDGRSAAVAQSVTL